MLVLFRTWEEAPVSANCNLLSGVVFMVDIWETSSNDDEVVKLGWLIVGVVILEPSFPASNLFPRVVIHMATLRVSPQPILLLSTVEVFIYPSNQYLPRGMVLGTTGVPLLPCGRIRL